MNIASWIEAGPVVIASLALLVLPGLALALVIRVRGLWAAALSPIISTTMFVIASMLLPLLGIPWTVVTALLGALGFGALVFVLFRFVFKIEFKRPAVHASRGVTATAWLLTAAPIGLLLIIGTGSADAISQTYDSIFHLNLVNYILDGGNASPLVAGRLASPDANVAFYPNAWNMLAALVVQVTGASIPVAVNSLNLALGILVWPSGILLLVRQLIGTSNLAMITTGVFAAGLSAFPLNLLYYGVLYPFYLGMLFVPVVLAIVFQVLGIARGRRIMSLTGLILLLLGALPAIALAHPGAMMAVLALVVPSVFVAVFLNFRAISRRARTVRVCALFLFLAFGFILLFALRPSYNWGPKFSMVEAAYQVVTLSLQGHGLQLVIAAGALVGLYFALRRRSPNMLAVVGVWLMGALLYFTAAGVPFWTPRVLALGVWYSDTPRLAAIFAVAAIPIAVGGVVWLVEGSTFTKLSRSVSAILLVVGFVAVHFGAGWLVYMPKFKAAYLPIEDARLLSPDELALIERLPQLVPKDAVIIGSPWTGTALAYALADRDVVMPHVQTRLNPGEALVMQGLRWADKRPEVCEAAKAQNIEYVLDFGAREVRGQHHRFPGIEHLSSSNAVELVASEGTARLYRVDAC